MGLTTVQRHFADLGYRWTRQRQAVLDVLREAQAHLDADEVYQQARRRDPRLSLSTVYRTLQVLRRQGLVRELHLGEGHHHYEFGWTLEGAEGAEGDAGGKPMHFHLVCRACGSVVEFDGALLDGLKRDLQRRYRFELGEAELELTGRCRACAAPGGGAVRRGTAASAASGS